MLDHFFTGLRQLVVSVIVIAVAVWSARTFLPELAGRFAAGEAAIGAIKTQGSALASDASSAAAAQSACAAEADKSLSAGRAIARVARPVKATTADQPMITAKDISDAIQ